jgi:hypothetical protein
MIDKVSVRRLITHPGRGHFLHLEKGGLKKGPHRGLSQEHCETSSNGICTLSVKRNGKKGK